MLKMAVTQGRNTTIRKNSGCSMLVIVDKEGERFHMLYVVQKEQGNVPLT